VDREVPLVPADEAAAKAQRDLVRRGYDVISRA